MTTRTQHWPAEIHLPITPTRSFLTRTHLLAASVRRFGGALADSRIVVTVSRDVEPVDFRSLLNWSRELDVEWRWVARELYAAHGMFATALERFRYDYDAPFVLHLDADVLIAGRLDELPTLVGDGLGGVPAHLSPALEPHPWADGAHRAGEDYWHGLFAASGLPAPELSYELTGWGQIDVDPRRRFCPAYFNLGMLAARAETMNRLGDVVYDEMEHVNSVVTTNYRCQLAVMLSLERCGITGVELPMRWNFPNDMRLWQRYEREGQDIRVLHYLRGDEVNRDAGLVGNAGVKDLVERPHLSPVNRIFQERVRTLHNDNLGAVVGLG